MSNDLMRKEFDAWFSNEMLRHVRAKEGVAMMTFFGAKEILWIGWKASRESLVIELPEHFEFDNPGEAVEVLKSCREVIETAGLKVKS